MINVAFCAIKDAFVFRLRGGGFFNLADSFFCRLVWSGSLTLSFIILDPSVSVLLVFIGTFLSMLIPHGFAYNMGRREQEWENVGIAKWWPGFWTKSFKSKLSFFWQDFIGMLSVGFIRSVLVFGPLVPFNFGYLYSIALCTISHPFCYMLGWVFNFTAPSLRPKSTEWAEVFMGAAWAMSIGVAQ